jgi:hypothetical protein
MAARIARHPLGDLLLKIDKRLTVVPADIQNCSGRQNVVMVFHLYVVKNSVNLAISLRYLSDCARELYPFMLAHGKVLAFAFAYRQRRGKVHEPPYLVSRVKQDT